MQAKDITTDSVKVWKLGLKMLPNENSQFISMHLPLPDSQHSAKYIFEIQVMVKDLLSKPV